MIYFSIVKCPHCSNFVELRFTGRVYSGICPHCKRELIELQNGNVLQVKIK